MSETYLIDFDFGYGKQKIALTRNQIEELNKELIETDQKPIEIKEQQDDWYKY